MTYLPHYGNAYSAATYPGVPDGLHVPRLESASGGPQRPSHPQKAEVESELENHEQYVRNGARASVVNWALRSWAFPGSTAMTGAGVEGKCPMASCSQCFQDFHSILLHLEGDCEGVKSQVEWEYLHARETAASSGPPHPCRGRCPWCRARSLLDKGKSFSLKRLSLKWLQKSLNKFRKGADTAKDIVPRHPPPRPTPVRSASYLSIPSSPPPRYEPRYELAETESICELGDSERVFPTLHSPTTAAGCSDIQYGFSFSDKLASDDAIAAIELHAPILAPSRPAYPALPHAQCRAIEPPRGISMMSDWTSSSPGRDSLISSCSQPSIPTPSTTASQLSIRVTTPFESPGPVYTDSYTCSPVGGSADDFSPPHSNIGLPAPVPLGTEARSCPALPSVDFTFGSSFQSLPTAVLEAIDEETQPQIIFNAPVPAAAPSSPTPRRYNERLERLKDTFYKLRKIPFGNNNGRELVTAGSLAASPDDVTLLGALDALDNALQGKEDKGMVFTFCFAYLAIAMATEIFPFYTALWQDMSEFVKSEGKVGLSWRFLEVSKVFIDTLWPGRHIPHNENYSRREQHENPGERDIRLLGSFHEMNTYLRAHPHPRYPSAHSPSRQYSFDSTTSTLLEQEPGQIPQNELQQPLPKFTNPIHTPKIPSSPKAPLPKVPISRHHPHQTITIPLRQRQEPKRLPSTSCMPCGFYPSPGADQQKKLTKHRITTKHRNLTTTMPRERKQLDDDIQEEWQFDMDGEGANEEEVRYPCTGLLDDGSTCPKKFSRKDNMRQHFKRKHPEEREDGREVKKRRVMR